MDPASSAVDHTVLRVEVRPQRSASVRGLNVFAMVITPVFLAPGIGFALLDAWPVTGFLGLDLVLLFVALRVHARAGKARETIEIDEAAAQVTRVDPRGREDRWRAPSNWLQVSVTGQPGVDGGVELRSHRARVTVGRWLGAEDRRDLAREVQAAVREIKRPPALGRSLRTQAYPRPRTSRIV